MVKFSLFLATTVATLALGLEYFEPNVQRTFLTAENDKLFLASSSSLSPDVIALNKIVELAGAQTAWQIDSSYGTKHNGLTHVYLRQLINDLPVDNCVANVNVDAHNDIVSMGLSAFTGEAPALAVASVSAEQAIFRLANHVRLNLPKNFAPVETTVDTSCGAERSFEAAALSSEPITATQMYVKVDEQRVALVWRVRVVSDMPHQPYGNFIGLVDATDAGAALLSLKDEVSWFMPQEQAEALSREFLLQQAAAANASDVSTAAERAIYSVYGIPDMDPNFGDRVTVQGPPDANASPLGWFDQGSDRIFTDTRGNNVFAQENPTGGAGWINNYRPNCGTALDCRFPIDLNQQPITYRDGAILNLFWWNNIIHDIFWLNGFDEASGNAQESNFNRGGREGDAVQANAQDGAGFNNANMATPVDGQRGRMRMYLWNGITPMRDGDLDSGIIVHEYAHHISQRLTGGPLNVGCLPNGQAGGMGEGWGDFFATMFLQTRQTPRTQQFPMGLYAARRGIRPFPYTSDRVSNPQTFGILNTGAPYNAVHAIGSVWCQILFQVYWEMRDAFSFDNDWFYGSSGNNALLRDVTDGFKLQPCIPNFVQARDAILQADRLNYFGRHVCAMWRGFAFRGLGTGAIVRTTNSVTESFDVPPECR